MCRGQFLSQYQLHNAIVYDVSDLLVDVPVGVGQELLQLLIRLAVGDGAAEGRVTIHFPDVVMFPPVQEVAEPGDQGDAEPGGPVRPGAPESAGADYVLWKPQVLNF